MGSKRVEEEYNNFVANNSWPQVYQRIVRQCNMFPFTCTEAKKVQNKRLNRYRDVNPYDHTRVILKRCNRDYINANFLKMNRANRKYILTQGPLVSTLSHFWCMIWEQNTRAIVMLNKVIEKNELKCHWYWPHGVGESQKMLLSDIDIEIEQTEENSFIYYSTRVFKVTDTRTDETRFITHFHYTTWPDFDVPSSPVAFLNFLDKVRASGFLGPDVGPAVVHCSAGIGRSGTFCLVDTVLLLIEKEGQQNVDVQSILVDMRRSRMGLIQTSEQLRFSYQAIVEGIKRLDPEYKYELDMSVNSPIEFETPPRPPPRGESLCQPPKRPLPAIPNSVSLGTLNVSEPESDSEDRSPTPPPRGLPPPPPPPDSPLSVISISSEEEDDRIKHIASNSTSESELRQRKQHELSERVATMKKRSRDADRWHSFKRSLFTPIAISVGFLIAGILIYTFVKH